jgi:hypothetical protein
MQLRNLATLVIIALTFYCNTNTSAQSSNNPDSTGQSLTEYKHVFDAYFINGYALGYRMNYNSSSEVRVVLDLSNSYSNSEKDFEKEFPTHLDDSYHRVNISLQYLLNIYKGDFGEIYFGGGPFFGFEWNKNSTTSEEYASLAYTYKTYTLKTETSNFNRNISTGVTFLLGFRGMVSSAISVFTEAQLSGGRSWKDYENETVLSPDYLNQSIKTSYSIDGWYFNFTSVRVGLRFSL